MVRLSFEVLPGRRLEYELLVPAGFDPGVARPFIISVSGVEQRHVNGFSQRLPQSDCVVAVPLRPHGAPLFYEGVGAEGDGAWHLKMFARHLLRTYKVESEKFLLAGVSNGGNAVLNFASLWPELCRGVIAVTAAIRCSKERMRRYNGLPIDLYVGSKDECGFYKPLLDFEASLRAVGHAPAASLTVFEGAGHCCSPLIDQNLLMGKIRMMLLRSSDTTKQLLYSPRHSGRLARSEVLQELQGYAKDLSLEPERTALGQLLVRTQKRSPRKTILTPLPTRKHPTAKIQRTDLPTLLVGTAWSTAVSPTPSAPLAPSPQSLLAGARPQGSPAHRAGGSRGTPSSGGLSGPAGFCLGGPCSPASLCSPASFGSQGATPLSRMPALASPGAYFGATSVAMSPGSYFGSAFGLKPVTRLISTRC